MKITLKIDDELLAKAKELAVREGRSVEELIDESLWLRLAARNEAPMGAVKLEQLRKENKAGIATELLPTAKSWDALIESLDKFPPDFMSDRDQPREAEQRHSLE